MKKIICLAVSASLLLFVGCGSGDKEVKASVKENLDRVFLAERPVEITGISVKWAGKSSAFQTIGDMLSGRPIYASGNFSVKAKTTERFYERVGMDAGLRKLGITDCQESEFNKARADALRYPEQISDRLPAVPEFPPFFDVRFPKGEKVTLTGSVELVNAGKGGWRVREITSISLSIDEKTVIRETRLAFESCRLDDPEAKEVVSRAIERRKAFIDKINSLRPEVEKIFDDEKASLEKKRTQWLADMQTQKDKFQSFCGPGMKYEGYYEYGNYTPARGMVHVIFESYMDTDQTEVKGTITFTLQDKKLERPFKVAVNTKMLNPPFPVTGSIDNSQVPDGSHGDAFFNRYNAFKGVTGSDHFRGLIQQKTYICILFLNGEMGFGIAESSQKSLFPLSLSSTAGAARSRGVSPSSLGAGSARQQRGLEGVWEQYSDGRHLGDFHVTFNERADQYEMSWTRKGMLFGGVQSIYDIRYDGQMWSFHVQDTVDSVSKYVLSKTGANTFERVVEERNQREKWERVRIEDCARCSGTGKIRCDKCNGTGRPVSRARGVPSISLPCFICSQTGKIKCPHCDAGKIRVKQ